MSQKSVKRVRKNVEDDFKTPSDKVLSEENIPATEKDIKNADDLELKQENSPKVDHNGTDNDKDVAKKNSKRDSRSRSKTPQINKNGIENVQVELVGDENMENKETEIKVNSCPIVESNSENESLQDHEKQLIADGEPANVSSHSIELVQYDAVEVTKSKGEKAETKSSEDKSDLKNHDSEVSDMEPLVLLSDEPCPELEFDENSDKDSGKISPALSRCKTRRSQTRNIPTPKTPKLVDDFESDKRSGPPTPSPDLISDVQPELPKKSIKRKSSLKESDNSISSENVSTKVEVGSDITRTEFVSGENESDFLSNLKSQSFGEVSKNLSGRKSIRSINMDVRRHTLRNNFHNKNQKLDLSVPYLNTRDSLDRAPSVKRKSRSETPEDLKRFKAGSPGYFSFLTSPLSGIKDILRTEEPTRTSTPKLTCYKDMKTKVGTSIEHANENIQNKWCTIM